MDQEKVVCIGFDGKEYKVLKSELVPRTSIYGVIIDNGMVSY
jgi:hypothetical protein